MNLETEAEAMGRRLVRQRLDAWERLMEIHSIAEWIDEDDNRFEVCMECCVVDVDDEGEPCERTDDCDAGVHEHGPGRPVCRTRAVLLGVER